MMKQTIIRFNISYSMQQTKLFIWFTCNSLLLIKELRMSFTVDSWPQNWLGNEYIYYMSVGHRLPNQVQYDGHARGPLQYFKVLFMNIQNINSILDTPACPKIEPQSSPTFEIDNLDFELETPSQDLEEGPFSSFHSSADQEQDKDDKFQEMTNQEDQELAPRRRSYWQFLEKKFTHSSISKALSISTETNRRPQKRRNL